MLKHCYIGGNCNRGFPKIPQKLNNKNSIPYNLKSSPTIMTKFSQEVVWELY